jgi:hypothetical protein
LVDGDSEVVLWYCRWIDVFESSQQELLQRVGWAVSLADKPDVNYKGVLKMKGLPFQVRKLIGL